MATVGAAVAAVVGGNSLYWLSMVASACTLLLYATGVPIILETLRKKSLGDITLFPYYAFVFSACMWTKYGLMKGDNSIAVVNGIGIVLQYANVLIFFICSAKKHNMGVSITATAGLLFLILSYNRYGLDSAEQRLTFMGRVCICGSITSFGSPLSSMKDVFKSQSTESMNFSICVLNFLVALLWAIYGYILHDQYVMFPNSVGCTLSVVQLALFCYYPARPTATPHVVIDKPSEV